MIEIPKMISKERTPFEFSTTMRLPLWGETAIRLVALFFIKLYMCYSNVINEYISENFFCQAILGNLTIF